MDPKYPCHNEENLLRTFQYFQSFGRHFIYLHQTFLKRWAGTVHKNFYSCYNLFFVCFFVCLHAGYDGTVSLMFSFYVYVPQKDFVN